MTNNEKDLSDKSVSQSREIMLNTIYNKIADKVLSFWCKIKHQIHWEWIYMQTSWDRNIWYDCFFFWLWMNRWYDEFIKKSENIETIWHPVMIWDCDIIIEKWPNYFDDWLPIIDLRIDKRKPIEHQNIKCIEYIHSLLSER